MDTDITDPSSLPSKLRLPETNNINAVTQPRNQVHKAAQHFATLKPKEIMYFSAPEVGGIQLLKLRQGGENLNATCAIRFSEH
jgi:hypothetical protein